MCEKVSHLIFLPYSCILLSITLTLKWDPLFVYNTRSALDVDSLYVIGVVGRLTTLRRWETKITANTRLKVTV